MLRSWFLLRSHRDTSVPVVCQCFGQPLFYEQRVWDVRSVISRSDICWSTGYTRTVATVLCFSKADQRSREGFYFTYLLTSECIFPTAAGSWELLSIPRSLNSLETIVTSWPISNRSSYVQKILHYSDSWWRSWRVGTLLVALWFFIRIGIGQTFFGCRKRIVIHRRVILKILHKKWWLLWL